MDGTPHRGRSLTHFSLLFMMGEDDDDEEAWAEAEECAGVVQRYFLNAQARGTFPNAKMDLMIV